MKRNYLLNEFGVTRHDLTLDNGLKVIFIEKQFAPIYAKLMIRAGSIYNGSDNGLAHLSEHLLVGASKDYPTKANIARILSNVGGFSNAYTSLEDMTIDSKVASSEYLPDMIKHFRATIEDMYLTPELFQKEQSVVITELAETLSENNDYLPGRILRKILTGDTQWYNSNLGVEESIRTLTIEDVMRFYTQHFVKENMLLVVTGGCTKEEISTHFSTLRLREGKTIELPLEPSLLEPSYRYFYEKDNTTSEILLLFNGPKIGSAASEVLRFICRYAHSGLGSIFLDEVRNKRGLAYGISSVNFGFSTNKYFGTTTEVLPDRLTETIDVLLECYKKLLNDGMTKTEIDMWNKRMYLSDKRDLETSKGWVQMFDDELYPLKDEAYGAYPDVFNFYQTITPEIVKSVVEKYIRLDQFHLFVKGKTKSSNYF